MFLFSAGHSFYAICWRGVTRTVNVMCGKTEIESMKHQLEALGVLRPKIAAIRRELIDGEWVPVVTAEEAAVAAAAAAAVVGGAADVAAVAEMKVDEDQA